MLLPALPESLSVVIAVAVAIVIIVIVVTVMRIVVSRVAVVIVIVIAVATAGPSLIGAASGIVTVIGIVAVIALLVYWRVPEAREIVTYITTRSEPGPHWQDKRLPPGDSDSDSDTPYTVNRIPSQRDQGKIEEKNWKPMENADELDTYWW